MNVKRLSLASALFSILLLVLTLGSDLLILGVASALGIASIGQPLPTKDDLGTARFVDINIPAYELTFYSEGNPPRRYLIAVGKPGAPTPTGNYYIATKVVNPTWYPGDGEEPVPPGPDNPVGSRWIGLSLKHYGIHGTNSPSSIGKAVSKGCIRMYPGDVEELFDFVKVGDPVIIRYDTVEVERDKTAGNWFLVVYEDLYRLGPPSREAIAEAARRKGAMVPAPDVLRKVLDLVEAAQPQGSRESQSSSGREGTLLRFTLVRKGAGEGALGVSGEYRPGSESRRTEVILFLPKPTQSRPWLLAVIPWPEYPRFVPAD